MRRFGWMIGLLACVGGNSAPEETGEGAETGEPVETGDTATTETEPDVAQHLGWIGSPCEGDGDCAFEEGWCILEPDWSDGHCTVDCDTVCPDADGNPVTFCIEPEDLTGGHCVSRCDFAWYPETGGCRPGYVCTDWERNNEPSRVERVCVPDAHAEETPCSDPTNLVGDDDCYLDLVSYGDPELAGLTLRLIDGTASVADAEAFLDRNHALSVEFIETELGRTVNPNYTSGHSSSAPMRGMIVHYTASQREDGTIKYFVGSSPHASTHFVVGSYRNGLIVQLFSHRNRTWHAGSTYNKDRFGFDFANAGYLDWSGSEWVDYADREYTMYLPLHGDQPVHVPDGIPGAESKYASKDNWQPYTYYQLLSFVIVGRALDRVYGLEAEAIERHGDVSGSRVDPGPHLPTSALVELVFSSDDLFEVPWLNAWKVEPDWIAAHPEAR